jgi:hypothetical protein
MKTIPENRDVCATCTTPGICEEKAPFSSCRLVTITPAEGSVLLAPSVYRPSKGTGFTKVKNVS